MQRATASVTATEYLGVRHIESLVAHPQTSLQLVRAFDRGSAWRLVLAVALASAQSVSCN
jgi:hypothetical protein